MDKEVKPGELPVIQGNTSLALVLSEATGFRIGGASERVIRVGEVIEFIDNDMPYIILNIIGGHCSKIQLCQ